MIFSRQIVCIVSAGLLVVHMGIGCCVHHRHALMTTARTAATGGHDHGDHIAAAHGCSHHAQEPVSSDGDCDHAPGDRACNEGPCSFLAGTKILMPDLAQPHALDAASGLMLPDASSLTAFATDALADWAVIPHLRSHLSKRVLRV